jgi:hypothetical protein
MKEGGKGREEPAQDSEDLRSQRGVGIGFSFLLLSSHFCDEVGVTDGRLRMEDGRWEIGRWKGSDSVRIGRRVSRYYCE